MVHTSLVYSTVKTAAGRRTRCRENALARGLKEAGFLSHWLSVPIPGEPKGTLVARLTWLQDERILNVFLMFIFHVMLTDDCFHSGKTEMALGH